MKKLITLLFLLHISLISQTNQWQWQNPLPQGNIYSDIIFIDSLNGWTIGNRVILKTTNGGKIWETKTNNIDEWLDKVFFINLQKGWVMSKSSANIYGTNDGGESWQFLSKVSNLGLSNFKIINDTLGFACNRNSELYRTYDGGISWEQLEIPFYIHLQGMEFISEKLGWVGGSGPNILKTTNGGDTWDSYSLHVSPFVFEINCIRFNNSNFGYISGYEEDQGIILITTNGGNSWQRRMVGISIWEVYFSDINNGWAKEANGRFYKTTNGGISWEIKFDNCWNFTFTDDNSWIVSLNRILYSKDGWNSYLEQTKTVTSEFINDIAVKDSLNVFICGNSNIINTSDGGKNWNIIHSLAPNNNLYSIISINNSIWSVGNYGQVVYSHDNGNSFSNFFLPNYSLNNIFFITEEVGFISGNNIGNGKIFKTKDGGLNWDSLTVELEGINKIKFSSDSLGFISSYEGISKTTNQGKTWQLIKSGFYRTLESIGNSVWTTSINSILFSKDLGQTWNSVQVYEIINFIIRTIESVNFINEDIGWLCVNDGRIYKTTDGGFTWKEEERLASIGLYTIEFFNENSGWAAGFVGAILHYGTKTTDINYNQLINLNDHQLSQNYPNPFNPFTKIKYTIPSNVKGQMSNVSLKIYDVLGREVTTLVNEEKHPGIYEVEFNAAGLASGIYYYQLKTGIYTETKKMIYLK